MATRIFIDGAAGTTGLEIRDRLAARAEFELLVLDEAQRKDVSARQEALREADVAILCLPDDAAREAVKLAEGSDTRIIDASSAHRTHPDWAYGLPEIADFSTGYEWRHSIANAQFVANPGCYPTGFLTLMEPLLDDGALPVDWPYTVHAVSGYSGGGKGLIERFERTEIGIAFRAYGLDGGHKHLPEMQKHAVKGGLKYAPVFSPSVVPGFRGMLVEIPLNLAAMGSDTNSPASMCETLRAYDGGAYEPDRVPSEPLIKTPPESGLASELLIHREAPAWDGIELFVCAGEDDWENHNATHVRLIARLDNLGKGASGAAIQNLNIMCGLPETTGLRL